MPYKAVQSTDSVNNLFITIFKGYKNVHFQQNDNDTNITEIRNYISSQM